MHIKTFTGRSISEVMEAVRASLGPDAVILETHQPKGRQVQVRAAVEAPPPSKGRAAKKISSLVREADLERRLRADLLGVIRTETLKTRSARLKRAAAGTTQDRERPLEKAKSQSLALEGTPILPDEDGWRRTGTMGIVRRRIKRPGQIEPDSAPASGKTAHAALPQKDQDRIAAALEFHAVPKLLREDLLRSARVLDTEDAVSALACAFDARFTFDPVPALPQRPTMLIGPPGVGKTVTAAKLASRAVLLGRGVDILSTDTLRAGAREQMQSFADILRETLQCTPTPQDLERALAENRAHEPRRPCIIDSPGTNPFDKNELADLRKFVRALDIEPVLVAAAGTEAGEILDAAQIFTTLGVQRMITTRIDAARRLGSILAAADGAKVNLAQFSMTPYIARGLSTLNPMSLAQLFLDGPDALSGPDSAAHPKEAPSP